MGAPGVGDCLGESPLWAWQWKHNKGKDVGLRVHPKSVAKMKAKIRQITLRSNEMGYEQRKLKLKRFITVRVSLLPDFPEKGLDFWSIII